MLNETVTSVYHMLLIKYAKLLIIFNRDATIYLLILHNFLTSS